MNKRQKKVAQMLVRAREFADGRAADFASAKPAVAAKFTLTVANLATAIADLGGQAAIQAGGAYGEETEGQRVVRADVEATLRRFNRSAASIAEEKRDPSIMDRFRMPTGEGDEELRIKLRAFAAAIDELALADEFDALGHDETAADLRTMADDFQGTEGEQGGALSKQVGATEAIPLHLREGRAAVKTLDAMIANRYAADAATLAAWKSASRIERDSGPEPANPPAPTPAGPTG